MRQGKVTKLFLGAFLLVGLACPQAAEAEGGTTTVIALTGDHAPGTPAGAKFGSPFFGYSCPVLNAAGEVASDGLLEAGADGVTRDNNLGIWAGAPAVGQCVSGAFVRRRLISLTLN